MKYEWDKGWEKDPWENLAARKNLFIGGNDLSKPVLDTSNEFNKNFPLFFFQESNFSTFQSKKVGRENLQVGQGTVPESIKNLIKDQFSHRQFFPIKGNVSGCNLLVKVFYSVSKNFNWISMVFYVEQSCLRGLFSFPFPPSLVPGPRSLALLTFIKTQKSQQKSEIKVG